MTNNKLTKAFSGIILAILVIGLAGCSQETPQATLELTESPESTDGVTEESETLAVETSAPQSTVILTYSQEADQALVDFVSASLRSLTQTSGLSFETIENLSPEGITTSVAVVVGVGPNIDIAGWALSSPDTQFVAVNTTGTIPGENISVIGDPNFDANRTAFMAGYLAALISEDYKVSALLPSNIANTDGIAEAFVVGARFFCGICQPKYPPYNQFPQWETLPVENASSGFEGAVDLLVSSGTEILYLHGSLLSTEMLDYLAGYGLKVISDGSPDMPYASWAGTLEMDLTTGLNSIWADVASGTGGFQAPGSITLTEMNSELVSEGRYRLFEEMVADLENGLISIETSP